MCKTALSVFYLIRESFKRELSCFMINDEDAVLGTGWLGLPFVVGGVDSVVVGETDAHATVLLHLQLAHPLLVNREGREVISRWNAQLDLLLICRRS